MMVSRKEENWKRQRICCLDRRQSVMDNATAKVSCFARAYHYKNNKMAAPVGVSYILAVKEK